MVELITRDLEKTITPLLSRKEIIGIRGARQVGKTTLLKLIQQKIPTSSAWVNCDLSENRRALEEAPLDFMKRMKGKASNGKFYLFMDEIQKVSEAGEKLKIIYDEFPNIKLFFSGSSSLELKAKVLPALVGRMLLFELYPLNFGEFLSAKDSGLYMVYTEKHQSLKNLISGKGELLPPSFEESFLKYWQEYLLFGGYPEVVKSSDEEEKKLLLKNLFNLYLEKDVVNFFRIEETTKFEDFLKFLSFATANLLVLSSASNTLALPYKKGEEFLEILQHTYVISLLRPFHQNLITEIRKSCKVYFLDLGLRNTVINNFLPLENRSDAGQLAENFVLQQLLFQFGDYSLHFWRTTGKAEVDFVLTKADEVIPVEVKLSEEKIGKSFHSFLHVYHPKKAIIVTRKTFKKQEINGTAVYWVPIFYF